MSWVHDNREPYYAIDRYYQAQWDAQHGEREKAKRILAEQARASLGELKKVCAWCGKHLVGPADGVVSHGICPECSERVLREWREGDLFEEVKNE